MLEEIDCGRVVYAFSSSRQTLPHTMTIHGILVTEELCPDPDHAERTNDHLLRVHRKSAKLAPLLGQYKVVTSVGDAKLPDITTKQRQSRKGPGSRRPESTRRDERGVSDAKTLQDQSRVSQGNPSRVASLRVLPQENIPDIGYLRNKMGFCVPTEEQVLWKTSMQNRPEKPYLWAPSRLVEVKDERRGVESSSSGWHLPTLEPQPALRHVHGFSLGGTFPSGVPSKRSTYRPSHSPSAARREDGRASKNPGLRTDRLRSSSEVSMASVRKGSGHARMSHQSDSFGDDLATLQPSGTRILVDVNKYQEETQTTYAPLHDLGDRCVTRLEYEQRWQRVKGRILNERRIRQKKLALKEIDNYQKRLETKSCLAEVEMRKMLRTLPVREKVAAKEAKEYALRKDSGTSAPAGPVVIKFSETLLDRQRRLSQAIQEHYQLAQLDATRDSPYSGERTPEQRLRELSSGQTTPVFRLDLPIKDRLLLGVAIERKSATLHEDIGMQMLQRTLDTVIQDDPAKRPHSETDKEQVFKKRLTDYLDAKGEEDNALAKNVRAKIRHDDETAALQKYNRIMERYQKAYEELQKQKEKGYKEKRIFSWISGHSSSHVPKYKKN